MEKNKTGKYLKYASGEIVLVVIGILIALQINTWNNEQNAQKAEIKYLNQIKISLEDSQLILNERIDFDIKILKSGFKLYGYLKNNKALNDTIKQDLYIPLLDQQISLNTAAYENLKNEGLSLISNDDIKFEIINIYDQELNYIQTTFANQFENYISTVVSPFYSKNFEVENGMIMEPNNYQELLKNREMTNIISTVNYLRKFAITKYEDAQKKIKGILIKIEIEIKTLKD
ncbi:MAG: hypothetical protein ACI87N_002199 [Flavobacteriales bacterium]|jgi:hypothetical protein